MAEKRFPRRRVQRQIAVLRDECDNWQADYAIAADGTPSLALNARYDYRAATLRYVVDLLDRASDELHDLPRLK